MKIKLEDGATMPTRAHSTDAGIDLYSMNERIVRSGECERFNTGVHIELPKGTAGLLVSKSGLNVHHGITSTGLIDEGYTGEIVVNLFNGGIDSYKVKKGDKISQLVVIPVLYENLELVDDLEETERGMNGFGSTGR